MMKRNRRRRGARPELVPTHPVIETYRNKRRQKLVPGMVVRVPPYLSTTLGVLVPERLGRLVRLYRRGEDPRVLADVLGLGGRWTAEAERVLRSNADLDENGERKVRRRGLNFGESEEGS